MDRIDYEYLMTLLDLSEIYGETLAQYVATRIKLVHMLGSENHPHAKY